MTTREFDGITLERVREHVWEIAQEGGMEVPARVLASEALLEDIGDDDSLQQLKNAAHLPGMTKYALAMPDAHQGYGFPVGGVGAIDAEDGCISPGAVGFDINCLSGDSEVALSYGRKRRIEDLWRDFDDEEAVVTDGEDGEVDSQIRLFTQSAPEMVYELTTETGDTIEATADHPIATPNGMVNVDALSEGEQILAHPFEGLPDEQPPEFEVLSVEDFSEENPQLVNALKERDLLPLCPTDEAFPRLLKLVGFHTGDGTFRGEQTWFYGEETDLQTIREDIAALGFSPSPVYERDRDHEVRGNTFEHTEHSIKVGSKAFRKLLLCLGAPDSPKVESEFIAPDYLDRLPDWQRALYLSAFFGAEMSAPATMTAKNLYCPSVSHNRRSDVVDGGETFMRDLMRHLNEIGIRTNSLERVEYYEEHDTHRFRFGIKNDSQTLIDFFTTVGYRYNEEKRRKSVLAAQYLKLKERTIDERGRIAEKARALSDGGVATGEIKKRFDAVNERFIERSIYNQRKGQPRPPATFPDYEEFRDETVVGDDLTVPVEIESVERIGKKPVYDIGVAHDAHNFVADGIVVSNCGVRMLRTPLTYGDVRGREEELVDALFDAIPSGLGGGGVVDGGRDAVEGALECGVEWAVEEGYATEDDLAHCEDDGRRPDAKPEFVSKKAKDRGMNQMGSLGSGNHFLEVQRVTDTYDDAVADAYGLREGEIVVLIHCGSRGLGHQICSDYVRRIEQEHGDLLEKLPDKDLASAPAGSKLAEEYYGAMCAAVNFAWVNRQLITHRTRETLADVFEDVDGDDVELLYDVAHNIAKRETHDVNGEDRELFVHRKGATRAFPAGREEVPAAYRNVGQPVIIPGSMGAGSYVLKGGERSLQETFGSTAHGAGRLMSRTQAKREFQGGDVRDDLAEQEHIYVKANSGATVAEEAPGVYKDVDEVVRVSDALDIGDRVARTFPVCNIKG
jgi:tRNA-splicing ligase RtcB